MIGLSGLVGLSVFCSVAGFTAGPSFTRLNTEASCDGRACAARQPSSKQKNAPAPATCAGWRSVDRLAPPTRMATDGDGEPEATAAAPRLKRVRRRRKDAGSIATAGDEEADEVVAASSPIEQEPVLPAVAFDSPAATAVTVEEEEVSPQVVAPAAAQVPVSGGGTKGKKVRVSNADDEMAETLASAASAASGVAGEAASVVGDAAKSAIGAAMSAMGQGGGAPSADEFDFDNVPRAGTGQRRKTTPGKSAADLADLGADIERFRKQENRQPEGVGDSLASGAKGVISSIIAVDFFVVIAFMLWFIAGVISSYGFSNTFLLDQFNDKWTPVVQPALGVLMGGTIAGGVVSKLGESEDENEETR